MSAFERTLKSILYRNVKAEISNFVQQTKLTAIYASLSKIIDAHIHEQFLIADQPKCANSNYDNSIMDMTSHRLSFTD